MAPISPLKNGWYAAQPVTQPMSANSNAYRRGRT